jgi:hypothetical protein
MVTGGAEVAPDGVASSELSERLEAREGYLPPPPCSMDVGTRTERSPRRHRPSRCASTGPEKNSRAQRGPTTDSALSELKGPALYWDPTRVARIHTSVTVCPTWSVPLVCPNTPPLGPCLRDHGTGANHSVCNTAIARARASDLSLTPFHHSLCGTAIDMLALPKNGCACGAQP